MDNKTVKKRLMPILHVLDTVVDLDSIEFNDRSKSTLRLMVELASVSGGVEQANISASYMIKDLLSDLDEDIFEEEQMLAKYRKEHSNV